MRTFPARLKGHDVLDVQMWYFLEAGMAFVVACVPSTRSLWKRVIIPWIRHSLIDGFKAWVDSLGPPKQGGTSERTVLERVDEDVQYGRPQGGNHIADLESADSMPMDYGQLLSDQNAQASQNDNTNSNANPIQSIVHVADQEK